MSDKRSWGPLFLLGAFLGALATLLFSTDEKGETKESVKKKVTQLKVYLKDLGESERVKEIFGKNTEELKKLYRQAKEELVDQLSQLKGSIEDIDKERYAKAVGDVIEELKKDTQATGEQLTTLKKFLTEDYKKIRSGMAKKTKKA